MNIEKASVFGLGAYLEAENPIYKDEYFWVFKMGIIDGDKFTIGGTGSENQDIVGPTTANQLDFRVERRFKSGWSYGVGTAKLNGSNRIEENKKGKFNYYVDFKFERKYYDLMEIFQFNKK